MIALLNAQLAREESRMTIQQEGETLQQWGL